MRDVCSNLPKTSSGQPAFERGEEIVRWQYFKPLLFMKDQFVGRKMCSSLLENASENDNVSVASAEGDDDVEEDVDDGRPTSVIEDITPTRKRTSPNTIMLPKTSKKAKTAEQFLMLEREKLDSLKKVVGASEKDEWRAYVDSLVHDLRQVKNPYLKVSMKNSISRIVGDTILQQLNMDQQQQHQQQQKQSYQQQQQLQQQTLQYEQQPGDHCQQQQPQQYEPERYQE